MADRNDVIVRRLIAAAEAASATSVSADHETIDGRPAFVLRFRDTGDVKLRAELEGVMLGMGLHGVSCEFRSRRVHMAGFERQDAPVRGFHALHDRASGSRLAAFHDGAAWWIPGTAEPVLASEIYDGTNPGVRYSVEHAIDVGEGLVGWDVSHGRR